MSMNLSRLLPVSLKNDFWTQFLEAVQEEVENYQQERVEPKWDIFDTLTLEQKNDFAQLLEIARMFGHSPDLTLRPNDIEFLRREVESIPFRIRKKSTPISYQYIFNTIPWEGQIALMYWNGSRLIRDVDKTFPLESTDKESPVTVYGSTLPSFLLQALTIDFSPTLYLDSVEFAWTLDQELSRLSTSHILLELVANQIIQDDSNTDHLVLQKYLDYLLNAANQNRKVTDTPHVGLQLTALLSSAGAEGPQPNTIADIGLTGQVTNTFDYDNSIATTLQVGIGSTPDETGLSERIYSSDIPFENRDTIIQNGEEWAFISEIVPGNSVNNEVLGTGDGSALTFTGNTAYAPLKPGKVEIVYTSSPEQYTVVDDSAGKLVGTKAEGTIDYETGAYSLTTERETTVNETLHFGTNQITGDPEPGVSQITGYFLANTPIKAGAFTISFSTGGGNNFYIVTDNGDGTIGSGDATIDGLSETTTSTIDYSTGEINIYFENQTDDGRDISSEYVYTSSSVVDNGADLVVQYETEVDLDIREAALIDQNGSVIAYATFPPVNLGYVGYYLNMNILIRENPFGS